MLPILFRDELLIAIRKPANWLLHRSPISRDQRFVLQTLRDQIGQRVYPVHRLDRATGGVLLFGLNPDIARELTGQFERRTVDKRYLAVVRGWTEEAGEIDHPIANEPDEPKREAVTRYRRLATASLPIPVDRYPEARYSLLELNPLTGRRHQLRRHLKHIAHPIAGDTSYGKGPHNRLFRQQFGCHQLLLLASRLSFDHPADGRRMLLKSGFDNSWQVVLKGLGWEDRLATGP